ncbi:MAG TPA: hypothetical protein VN153_03200, partial [Tahibacter sp.]|nr:hypothetical protein [Tahibacter sp.]
MNLQPLRGPAHVLLHRRTTNPAARAKQAALALVAALSLAGCSQLDLTRLYLANNGSPAELGRPLPITLPYRDVDGWILLPAKVNSRAPIEFVLDTGASVVALIADERTAHLGLDL